MDALQAARLALPGVEVRVVERCASTNSALLAERSAGTTLLAAEAQTAGRGQRGRRWQSTPGADITFSLARSLRRPARELASLSLVAGVAACRALRGLGLEAVSLKWPNDLMMNDAKLGGILVETRADGAMTRAVVGVGINCRRNEALRARLRRRVAFLEELMAPERNVVIREVAQALVVALQRFEEEGFGDLRTEWEAMDAFAGRRLRVRLADGRSLSGLASGLASDGALRLLTRSGERTVRSGRILSALAP